MSTTKNIPASVHARLLNISKATERPFNELLQYYGMERFLFRLSQSKHRDDLLDKFENINKEIVILGISSDFCRNDPELERLLRIKLASFL